MQIKKTLKKNEMKPIRKMCKILKNIYCTQLNPKNQNRN